jgi:Zn-dependent protease
MTFVILLFIIFFSIILHEVSHGAVAYLLGDPTAKDAGRLTLNPLKHIDPVGSILLPGILLFLHSKFLFGWARPVPYNPLYFRRRRLGTFVVALAGPAVNVILATGFSIALRMYGPETALSPVLVYGTAINLFLAFFNLLPVPPLDGSKALAMLLPAPARRVYLSMGRWGIVLLLALSYTGLVQRGLLPVFDKIFYFFTGLHA